MTDLILKNKNEFRDNLNIENCLKNIIKFIYDFLGNLGLHDTKEYKNYIEQDNIIKQDIIIFAKIDGKMQKNSFNAEYPEKFIKCSGKGVEYVCSKSFGLERKHIFKMLENQAIINKDLDDILQKLFV